MTESLTHCPICGNSHIALKPTTGDYEDIECGLCGDYMITRSGIPKLESADERKKKILFQWLYDQQKMGEKPSFDTSSLDQICSRPPKTFSEITENYLSELAKRTFDFGQQIERFESRLRQAAGSFDDRAYQYLIDHLADSGLIKIDNGNLSISLTPLGLERIEKLKGQNPDSAQAFVAMWFNEELKRVWTHGLETGINAAGFRGVRIDQKEHANKICDEIIAEIRRSRFVVADYTGQRGGVYYEAGFASGIGLLVINTCRKDHMAKLHFDIRQYNCIDWEDESELAERLQKRIEAVIGEGPLKAKNT